VPSVEALNPLDVTSNPCIFVDSVIHFLSKSRASCGDILKPVPDEAMFLLLIPPCGEPKCLSRHHWAAGAGAYELIELLLYGLRKQLSEAPNVIG
jgi:hypothetical protein